MSTESFLSNQLQKFSVLDIALVKTVYFIVGLFVFSLYPSLALLSWVFYLCLMLICALPLWIHLFSQQGGAFARMHGYLKTNTPSNQVLLFLTMFFLALMLGTLMPVMVSGAWWIYSSLILALAIKPLTTTWFW